MHRFIYIYMAPLSLFAASYTVTCQQYIMYAYVCISCIVLIVVENFCGCVCCVERQKVRKS